MRSGETPDAAVAQLDALDCLCGRELTQGDVGGFQLTNVNLAAIPEFARTGMAQFTTLLSITVGLLLLVGCLTVGMQSRSRSCSCSWQARACSRAA